MNIKFLLIAGAVIVAGFAANHAMAFDNRDLSDFSCRSTASGNHCVNTAVLENRREKESKQKVLPLLANLGYPADMAAVKAGWSKRKNCYTLPKGAVTGDAAVDKAKIVYCIVKSKGYAIPKPTIVAAY